MTPSTDVQSRDQVGRRSVGTAPGGRRAARLIGKNSFLTCQVKKDVSENKVCVSEL